MVSIAYGGPRGPPAAPSGPSAAPTPLGGSVKKHAPRPRSPRPTTVCDEQACDVLTTFVHKCSGTCNNSQCPSLKCDKTTCPVPECATDEQMNWGIGVEKEYFWAGRSSC